MNSAPGKNYGLIKNQWERWQLSALEEAEPKLEPPPDYSTPAVQPKHVGPEDGADASQDQSKSGGRRKAWNKKEGASGMDNDAGDGSPGEKLPPLPTLIELTDEEKLHLAINKASQYSVLFTF